MSNWASVARSERRPNIPRWRATAAVGRAANLERNLTLTERTSCFLAVLDAVFRDRRADAGRKVCEGDDRAVFVEHVTNV